MARESDSARDVACKTNDDPQNLHSLVLLINAEMRREPFAHAFDQKASRGSLAMRCLFAFSQCQKFVGDFVDLSFRHKVIQYSFLELEEAPLKPIFSFHSVSTARVFQQRLPKEFIMLAILDSRRHLATGPQLDACR